MKKLLLAVVAVLLIFGVAACGGTNNNSNDKELNQPSNQTQDETQNEGQNQEQDQVSNENRTEYPLTIQDASGIEFTFDQAPERIASIAPSQTEILYALGLGERIVGVSDFDNYPEEAATKPKLGGAQVNAEATLNAQADIIFGELPLNGSVLEGLQSLGMNIFTSEPQTIDDVIETILLIGLITDKQTKAEEVAEQMRADKAKVLDIVGGLTDDQKKKVYIEYSPLWTAGKGTYMDEMITLAGGKNIAADMGAWVQISSEVVIEANPDVIIYADTIDYETNKPLVDSIMKRPGWGELSAMQDQAIVGVNEDILSRSGPRLTDALLVIAKGIYPDLFQGQ